MRVPSAGTFTEYSLNNYKLIATQSKGAKYLKANIVTVSPLPGKCNKPVPKGQTSCFPDIRKHSCKIQNRYTGEQ